MSILVGGHWTSIYALRWRYSSDHFNISVFLKVLYFLLLMAGCITALSRSSIFAFRRLFLLTAVAACCRRAEHVMMANFYNSISSSARTPGPRIQYSNSTGRCTQIQPAFYTGAESRGTSVCAAICGIALHFCLAEKAQSR